MSAGMLAYVLPAPEGRVSSAAARILRESPLWILGIILLVYTASSAVTDLWFFPTEWHGTEPWRSNPLAHGAMRSVLLALALTLLFRRWARPWWPWAMAAIICAGYAFSKLNAATGMDMIYRVDSPSFVYRYWSFAQTFPRPGFYDPHWNAGVPVPYLVASGIWSVGLFLLPFLSRVPADQLYTPSLAALFLVALPALAWFSMKWVGARPRARWIAALLALAPCQRFWVHLLHYGTAPSLFAMSMSLPLAALAWKLLYLDRRAKPGTWVALFGLAFIMLAWPGGVMIAGVFAAVGCFHVRRLFPHKWKGLLFVGVGLVMALLPLALVPLWYSNIPGFLQTVESQPILQRLLHGLGVLGQNLRGTNAVILVLGVLGSVWGPDRRARWIWAPIIFTLVAVSGWGEEFKKLLQTERLIIPAVLIAILPAAAWLDRMVRLSLACPPRRHAPSAAFRGMTAWVLAIVLLGGYQGAKTWDGRGLAPYHTMPAHTRELVDWMAGHVPGDGRVMFAGSAVHAYGGAKIAAFPMFTGREMMACDYYGFSPKLVEFQYPPRAFRHQGPDVLFEFMNLYNVTHVVTHHDDWKSVFAKYNTQYRLAHASGRVSVFEVLRPSSMFLKGEGRVRATFDRIDIEVTGDPGPVVIKYNWADGWVSDPGVRLFPHDAGRGVVLIGLDPGDLRQVTIRYRP